MKINDIYESTTSGSVATVSQPMNGKAISRNNVVGKGVYTNAKVGNLLTGKKTKKTFANSLSEAPEFKNRQQVIDYFIKQGKTASQGAMAWERGYRGGKKKTNNPVTNWASDQERRQNNREDDVATLGENDLHEDDFILVPGQGNKLISGFIPHDQDRTDHEVQMARGDLFQCAKNAKQILDLIRGRTEDEGIEGWVQAKITKASDYLTTIRQYLEGLNVREGEVIQGPWTADKKLKGDVIPQAAKFRLYKEFTNSKYFPPGLSISNDMDTKKEVFRAAHKFLSDKKIDLVNRSKMANEFTKQFIKDILVHENGGVIAAGGVGEGKESQDALDTAVSLNDLGDEPTLTSTAKEYNKKEIQKLISKGLLNLTPKEERVLRMRFFNDMTFQEIGNTFGLSLQRIRQITDKAIRKLKDPRRGLSLPWYRYKGHTDAPDNIEENIVNEKAVSKQQQKFMGMAHAIQKGEKISGASNELKKAAKGMTKKAAHDYAATKHKGLPTKVKKD
jgi:RNA polymerase sigma factor (sigma-70 family)